MPCQENVESIHVGYNVHLKVQASVQPLLVSSGGYLLLDDINSAISLNSSKKKEKEKLFSIVPCSRHSSPLLTPRAALQAATLCMWFIKHCTLCGPSQGSMFK